MPKTQERFRAVYVPQVPMKGIVIEAPSLEKAVYALESMIALSVFEYDNNVKPDYSDMAVIERWDGDEWEDVDEDEWAHIYESAGFSVGSTR